MTRSPADAGRDERLCTPAVTRDARPYRVPREIGIAGFARWEAQSGGDRPDVSFVPALARRRLTPVERAAMHVAHEATVQANAVDEKMPVVFASRWGEIGTTFKLISQFREEGEMSPAGFSNSVHNAAPGAWSLFTKNTAPYTSIAGRERSLECGLLEALVQLIASGGGLDASGADARFGRPDGGKVLFVFAEEATPEFYRADFPAVEKGCALAALLDLSGGIKVEFRHEGRAPLSFAALAGFLSGASDCVSSADFLLAR